MKVILLKPIRKLGKLGDVVDVKDGFGRNFLLPRKLAERATADNIKYFEQRRQELEKKDLEYLAKAKKVAEKLDGKDFLFICQCSDDGRLYGSVSPKDIATEVAKEESIVNHSHINLSNPIKKIGIHEIYAHLHPDVDIKLLVNVARNQSEGDIAIKSYKTEETKNQDEQL